MFRKPFHVKSSSQLKGSEKKKMKSDFKTLFPDMDSGALDTLIPSRKDEEFQAKKIITHGGEVMLVYVLGKTPLFFSFKKDKNIIYPTIYALWQAPNLIPHFYMQEPVLKNIQNGADLMCPGIIFPQDMDIRSIKKGSIVSISVANNLASVAIGYTVMSGDDMIESGFRNKGVIILHSFGDLLWQSGTQEDIPLIEKLESLDLKEQEDGADSLNEPADDSQTVEEPSKDTEEVDDRSESQKMDDLLKSSFLTALKTSCKHIELPMLTSNFFRVHMVEAAKPNELNVKKSSYKKLSAFLRDMSLEHKLIVVSELTKGVESITAINYESNELRFHKVERPPVSSEESATPVGKQFAPPVIEELFLVSAAVLQFFRPHPKKSVFNKSSVREFLKDYVSREELASGPKVRLDPVLAELVLEKSENNVTEMRWDDLTERILGKMSPGYCINGVKKLGSIAPIEMKTVTRSGNKKVTLVYNLDLYGIDPHEVAHKCQVGVAASTSVDLKPPNRKTGSEVLIQGNQIAYVTKLLTEVYGVNKKHLMGTENAIKPKKKK